MVDLVVHHIEFAHIRPLNRFFILIGVLKWILPAGQFFNRGQNHLVRKTMVDLVVNYIELAHIRPINMLFIQIKPLG